MINNDIKTINISLILIIILRQNKDFVTFLDFLYIKITHVIII